ncbi:hypothetical protein QAD02_017820 [Eretmocerus hayati]|uniref:Uncharacterized protein n=1 Tax=Eretmocerus hayati TaxID=131215 RepID=A0ACC2PEY0_9HYME|nr:hypothetical protein QAD02_017820 [Eretmocerus hayati]
MNYEDDDEREAPKAQLPELFKLVDEKKKDFIQSLRESVSISSIADDPCHIDDIMKMLKLCAMKLEKLGAAVEVVDGSDKDHPDLPPVLFANLFVGEEYKTICVYGNIDVKDPEKLGYDKRCPFELEDENGRLYGCGISDNKAPLFCWFNALKILKDSKMENPVNVKFVIEGTSELHSRGLLNAIKINKKFFKDVEFICLTIDQRINEDPCIKYGYRGICHFSLKVSCGEKRVHGGTYGGAFNQPLLDALNVTASLFDQHGKITVTEFLQDIQPITERDIEHCETEFCCIKSLEKETNLPSLLHKNKPSRILMHKTRLPNLSVHAFHIKSASADKDDCASIPNKIEAIFSVRLVPNQTTDKTYNQFKKYIEKKWQNYKSSNSYEFKMKLGFNPWQEDPDSEHYQAAAIALETVFKKPPRFVGEGKTMPAVSIFRDACPGSSIIVIPISGHDDNHHSSSESISTCDYLMGIKLVLAYMCEIHELTFKR